MAYSSCTGLLTDLSLESFLKTTCLGLMVSAFDAPKTGVWTDYTGGSTHKHMNVLTTTQKQQLLCCHCSLCIKSEVTLHCCIIWNNFLCFQLLYKAQEWPLQGPTMHDITGKKTTVTFTTGQLLFLSYFLNTILKSFLLIDRPISTNNNSFQMNQPWTHQL